MKMWPGKPYPLGATFDGVGTNFALFSEIAQRVELCLFDDAGLETRFELPEATANSWHGYLPRVGPGQKYGYRVHGPNEPHHGRFCDSQKLLLDPYARAIDGTIMWHDSLYPGKGGDSAPYMPRSVVISPYFSWDNDRHPETPWHETLIYELHVGGFTKLHPEVPESLRGTYAGLAHPAVVEYLKSLGVTAVELLPVHQFVHDRRLVDRGLTNYWGYDSIGYFAPHNTYAAPGCQVSEFKEMVRAFHAEKIEVILDVVYNHTAEGGAGGPILSFRGIDNPAYYRLDPHAPSRYIDYTGCGNSMNMRHPHVLQLIMDSLRYWVLEMHVDGFRFDLAAALARELHEVDRLSAFFDLIQQDPVLQQVKLIAEPWDVGEGGYQVGNFPPLWSEWNGKFRDCVREFWRGTEQSLGELAFRLTGSSDLYANSARRPHASINFVTSHDGFTLHDLVTYNEKHNEANAEESGDNHNRSWNCGVEGETDDPSVLALRARQKRNFFATLLLSQGVPMICAADEFARTQGGNNNAYCQDNETSWVNWEAQDQELLAFIKRLVALRLDHPVFRRRRWFEGRSIRGSRLTDIGWFRPDGEEMSDADWQTAHGKGLGVFLNGNGIASRDRRGRAVTDDSFYVIINADRDALTFLLPHVLGDGVWSLALDTANTKLVPGSSFYSADARVLAVSRSLKVLQRKSLKPDE